MPNLLPSGIVKVPVTPIEECLPGGRSLVTLRPDFSTAALALVPVLFSLSSLQPCDLDDIRALYVENNHKDNNGNSGDVVIKVLESGSALTIPFGAVVAKPLWITAQGVIEISVIPATPGQSAGLPFIMLLNWPVMPFYIHR